MWDVLWIRRCGVTYDEFKTLWLYNFGKTLKNFVWDSFYVKLTEICHKNRGGVLASSPPLRHSNSPDQYLESLTIKSFAMETLLCMITFSQNIIRKSTPEIIEPQHWLRCKCYGQNNFAFIFDPLKNPIWETLQM